MAVLDINKLIQESVQKYSSIDAGSDDASVNDDTDSKIAGALAGVKLEEGILDKFKKKKTDPSDPDSVPSENKSMSGKAKAAIAGGVGAAAGAAGGVGYHLKQKAIQAEAARKAAEAAEKAKEASKHSGIGSEIMQRVKDNPKAAAAVGGGAALLGAGLAARKFLKARKK